MTQPEPTSDDIQTETDIDVSEHREHREDTSPTMIDIKFPATTCVFGKKFAGKSNFIKLFLQLYSIFFEAIIIISNTAKSNGEYDNVFKGQKKKLRIVDRISQIELEHVLDEAKASRKKPPILLLFDDILGMKGLKMKSDIFKELVTSGRHHNISLLMASQTFKGVPVFMRTNCEYGVFFNMPKNEIDKVFDEYGPNVTKKTFLTGYKKITKNVGFGIVYRLNKDDWFLLQHSEFKEIDNSKKKT